MLVRPLLSVELHLEIGGAGAVACLRLSHTPDKLWETDQPLVPSQFMGAVVLRALSQLSGFQWCDLGCPLWCQSLLVLACWLS